MCGTYSEQLWRLERMAALGRILHARVPPQANLILCQKNRDARDVDALIFEELQHSPAV